MSNSGFDWEWKESMVAMALEMLTPLSNRSPGISIAAALRLLEAGTDTALLAFVRRFAVSGLRREKGYTYWFEVLDEVLQLHDELGTLEIVAFRVRCTPEGRRWRVTGHAAPEAQARDPLLALRRAEETTAAMVERGAPGDRLLPMAHSPGCRSCMGRLVIGCVVELITREPTLVDLWHGLSTELRRQRMWRRLRSRS